MSRCRQESSSRRTPLRSAVQRGLRHWEAAAGGAGAAAAIPSVPFSICLWPHARSFTYERALPRLLSLPPTPLCLVERAPAPPLPPPSASGAGSARAAWRGDWRASPLPAPPPALPGPRFSPTDRGPGRAENRAENRQPFPARHCPAAHRCPPAYSSRRAARHLLRPGQGRRQQGRPGAVVREGGERRRPRGFSPGGQHSRPCQRPQRLSAALRATQKPARGSPSPHGLPWALLGAGHLAQVPPPPLPAPRPHLPRGYRQPPVPPSLPPPHGRGCHTALCLPSQLAGFTA